MNSLNGYNEFQRTPNIAVIFTTRLAFDRVLSANGVGTLCGKIKLIMRAKIGKLCDAMRSLSLDYAVIMRAQIRCTSVYFGRFRPKRILEYNNTYNGGT